MPPIRLKRASAAASHCQPQIPRCGWPLMTADTPDFYSRRSAMPPRTPGCHFDYGMPPGHAAFAMRSAIAAASGSQPPFTRAAERGFRFSRRRRRLSALGSQLPPAIDFQPRYASHCCQLSLFFASAAAISPVFRADDFMLPQARSDWRRR